MIARAERRRRGLGLAIALFALVFFGLIAASLARQALEARRVLRLDERQAQADWLAASGLELASARLARAPDYEGETWALAADRLGGTEAAEVRIAVAAVDGRDDRRRVAVVADYPAGSTRRVRRSREAEVRVDIPAKDDPSPGPERGPEEEP